MNTKVEIQHGHTNLIHPLREGRRRSTALLAAILFLSVAIPIGIETLFDRGLFHQTLFGLTNFVGPTTQSLLNGGGLSFCTIEMGTPGNPICFHAGRMPIATLTVATGIRLFGNSFVYVSLFKAILLLLPLQFAIFLVWKRMPKSRYRQLAIALLLLVPFVMTPFLANIVNLQFEEDYAYSLIAAALAIVLFGPFAFPGIEKRGESATEAESNTEMRTPMRLAYFILFVLSVDALYLSKSSLALAVAVLTAAYFVQQRGTLWRIALLLLVAAAPAGWALHQHHASGRYSLGTSLDGINLHKGNVATFLNHYPPPPLTSLDDFDVDLNHGLYFPDEWSFNDYHMQAGLAYIRSHPRETLVGGWRKFSLLYLSLTKYGSSDTHGLRRRLETFGLLVFRCIFWGSIGWCLYWLFRPERSPARDLAGGTRAAAVTYLALVAACALPYLIGFGYTRHASILIYPACLMVCRLLCEEERPARIVRLS